MTEQIAQGIIHLGGSFDQHRITGRVHQAPRGVDKEQAEEGRRRA